MRICNSGLRQTHRLSLRPGEPLKFIVKRLVSRLADLVRTYALMEKIISNRVANLITLAT
jgi:hypothetical protein